MIAIINGCGSNIASVQFALARLGRQSVLTTDSEIIKSASHVILPGVGTAKQAMDQIGKLKLINIICELEQPVLGICLGMQILFEFSEEENIDCLGILPGKIEKFPKSNDISIPHMGWNQLSFQDGYSLFKGIPINSFVYFVHSFLSPINQQTIARTVHGIEFSAAVNHENYFGVQFHPERSGKIGEQILNNFLQLESVCQ